MKRTHIQIMSEFIEGLNTATDSTTQLVHSTRNPKWLAVRDMLNIIRDGYVNQIGQTKVGQ